MRYKIAIVEDEQQSIDLLIEYFQQYAKENNVSFDFFVFHDGDEITHEYSAQYDIIFLDIEMKRQDGMSAAEQIRHFDPNVIIVFVTNMRQYAIKGYKVRALSYLVKPVTYFAFSQELKKLLIIAEKNQLKKFLLIPTEKGKQKISSNEIMYIESYKHDLFIFTNEETYKIRETIKKMEEKLASFSFARSDNSYLINLNYVEAIEEDMVVIKDKKINISRSRKKEFMKKLTIHLGEKK